MKILLIHQNFPGQFRHLAPALVAAGHEVMATVMRKDEAPSHWAGVKLWPYYPGRGSTPNVHPWLIDLETKVIRGEACFALLRQLNAQGFVPDVVVAHPGWGESLFVKEVWPKTRLGLYCEYFYRAVGADVGFDPEFKSQDEGLERCRLHLKNANHLLHVSQADAALSPTLWQADSYPLPFRNRITVVHDGIDTKTIRPGGGRSFSLKDTTGQDVPLMHGQPLITFVNRNLEPYRGYHSFMRALPILLRKNPDALIVIVGSDGVSYGTASPSGETWRALYVREVRPEISDADWQRVVFVGTLPRAAFTALLQRSTVHVYLSYPFVLSWSLIEAMSAGCAIVASDTAPVREVISDGEVGRLVDFFDVSALADSVTELLGDAVQRQRLGAAARALAIARYDLETVCLPQQIQWVQQLAANGQESAEESS